jgi:hypothetical protein
MTDLVGILRISDEALPHAAADRIVELEKQIEGHFAEHHEVTQALGKALGYPTEGPEVGGDHSTVCVGDHAPGTLAQEAARRLTDLEQQLSALVNVPAKVTVVMAGEWDAARARIAELEHALRDLKDYALNGGLDASDPDLLQRVQDALRP